MIQFNQQSEYVIEKFDSKTQISRFGSDGNRIVCLNLSAFDADGEAQFIVTALNLWANLDTHISKEAEDAESY
jgi:hypothetical protein